MSDKPILMCGEMVRATLADAKTQTRRIVKPMHGMQAGWLSMEFLGRAIFRCLGRDHEGDGYGEYGAQFDHPRGGPLCWIRCPYGQPGDRLWVKETFSNYGSFGPDGRKTYRADIGDEAREPHGLNWRPSIFCSLKASRITLEVLSVRVERLQEISEMEAIAEGTTPSIVGDDNDHLKYRAGYQTLWESINGAGSWAANPWVWVVGFKRIKP